MSKKLIVITVVLGVCASALLFGIYSIAMEFIAQPAPQVAETTTIAAQQVTPPPTGGNVQVQPSQNVQAPIVNNNQAHVEEPEEELPFVQEPQTEPQRPVTETQVVSGQVKPIVPGTVPTPEEPDEDLPFVPDDNAQPFVPENFSEQVTQSSTEKTYQKTGEMELSDSADNKYIAAISEKYGVETKNLVALYTVPENDSNIVLEFDGTIDDDGIVVRNKNTLVAIYSIDKKLNSKRASQKSDLNEYSYAEMKLMFFATTEHIMPEFDELV